MHEHAPTASARSPQVRPSRLLEETRERIETAQTVMPRHAVRPQILELLNIADYRWAPHPSSPLFPSLACPRPVTLPTHPLPPTHPRSHHVDCSVPIGEPIFQPFPTVVSFSGYEPFQTYESVLYLRNNDTVGRRVKVLPPNSAFFSVSKVPGKGKGMGATDKASASGTVIAPGMEVAYLVKFDPTNAADCVCDLVVCTEREKFVVPVIAVGQQPALDLPDIVEFDSVPCKSEVKRTFQVANVGNSQAHFTLATSLNYSISPTEGHLSPGESLQCTITFCPEEAGEVAGELELVYDNGQVTVSRLLGYGREVNVQLSADTVQLLPTYMNKESQKTFKVFNESETVVKFSFRQNPSEAMDLETTASRVAELYSTAALTQNPHTLSLPDALLPLGESPANAPDVDGASSEEEEAIFSTVAVAEGRALKRQRRALLTEKPLFESRHFEITPLEGTIWPGGEVEVTVQFRPERHEEYEEVVHLDITGRSNRLPVTLKGSGLGPKAMFSYDVLDVGDTFIHTVHQYEVELYNRGEVPAEFRLTKPDTYFGGMFDFEPASGVVPPDSVQMLQCRFLSDALGEFAETFQCEVAGAFKPLTLDFRGQVVGPSFDLDKDELDFGSVSFGFRYTKELTITNTCEIPMRFAAYMEKEREPNRPEFSIVPSGGVLKAGASTTVTVEFVSQRVSSYANNLLIDVPGVGRKLRTVPVRATSFVPEISMTTQSIDYGDCFLQFPYKQTITLVNESKLPAKFEVLPQDDQSKNLGVIRCEPTVGGVPAMGTTEVTVVLSTARRGRMQLPVRVKVYGSDAEPLECVMSAHSIGPALEFYTGEQTRDQRSTKANIEFGQCPTLRPNTRILNIFNPCPVPASYKAFIESPTSVYSINPREGMLQPGSVLAMEVTCTMDDTRKFSDTLHILVQDGDNVAVPLSAVGTGATVVATGLKDGLDMGKQLVGRPFETTVVLRNSGRRPQTVSWHNTMKDIVAKAIKAQQNARKKRAAVEEESSEASGLGVVEDTSKGTEGKTSTTAGGKADNSIPEVVFTVSPEKMLLNPKQEHAFVVTGMASRPGDVLEKIILRASVGSETKDILKTEFKAECTRPLLECSEEKIVFTYSWTEDSVLELMEQTVTLKNTSELPLTMTLRTQSPFTVDKESLTLKPGCEEEIIVDFDPGFRTDRESDSINGKLTISYLDCPHKDTIDLVGEINFPNLKMQNDVIDFGCVLTDTVDRRYFSIKNTSSVPAAFDWSLAAQAEEDIKQTKSGPKYVHPSEVFDILPVKGVVQPGASERIEVSYFAQPGAFSNCWAVCSVKGGPTYEVRMSAESSYIKYALDTHLVDIGRQQYNRATEKEIQLQNTGRVPFSYVVNLSRLSRASIVVASPLSGTIGPGNRDFIRLRITPGVPDRIAEEVVIEVAHCEPEVVRVEGEGTYQGLMLTLPRMDDAAFKEMRAAAREALLTGGQRLHPSDAAALLDQAKDMSATRARTARTSRIETAGGRAQTTHHGLMESPSEMMTGRGKAGRVGAYNPTALEVDMESDRMHLCKILMDKIAGSVSEAPMGTEASRVSVTSKTSTSSKKASVVVSHYLLDLGHITKGTQKTKKFRLLNTSPSAISVSVDRKKLSSCGIAIDPEKLNKIAEYSTVNFSLTLDTVLLPTGLVQCSVPVEIKGGPSIFLTVKANVVVPELQVSRDVLDFDAVLAGHCKIITVQLHNPKDVPCDWTVKKPMEGDSNWQYFECQPNSGVLPPGESTNVKVVFTPVGGREKLYTQRIPIKISYNPRQVFLNASGRGQTIVGNLSSQSLALGAILPGKEGEEQEPNKIQVELVNPSSEFPIEVFSLDLDGQYRDEEEILTLLPLYGPDGTILARPRNPGEEFWPEYREMVEKAKAAKAAEEERRAQEAEEAARAAEAAALAAEAGETAAAEGGTPDAVGDEAGAEEGVGELEEPAPELEDPKAKALYIVVTGAPGSGRTVVAEQLAERYGLSRVSFSDLVMSAADMEVSIPEEAEDTTDELKAERERALALSEAVNQLVASMDGTDEAEPVSEDVIKTVLPVVLEEERYLAGVVVDGLEGSREVGPSHSTALDLLAHGVGLSRNDLLDEKGKPTGKHTYEGVASIKVLHLEVPREEIAERLGVPPSAVGVLEEGATPVKKEDKAKKAPAAKKGDKGKKGDKTEPDEPPLSPEELAQQELLHRFEAWEEAGSLEKITEAAGVPNSAADDAMQISVRSVDASAVEPSEVMMRAVGIEWSYGELLTWLPKVDRDKYLVPPDYTLEIIRRPRQRPRRNTPSHFQFFTIREGSPPPPDPKAKKPRTPDPDAGPHFDLVPETRWVLAPGEAVTLEVHFKSTEIGKFQERFMFEVRGGNMLELNCEGTCAYPQIATDYRNVFYRKAKGRPSTPLVNKQFIISEEVFDFGPLLAGRKKDGYLDDKVPENGSLFRITNNGLFDLKAKFWLQSTVKKEGEPGTAEGGEFIVNPPTMELAIGETQDLRVFAFPSEKSLNTIEDTVVCSVDQNPKVSTFKVKAIGTKPQVEVTGIEDMKAGIKFQRLLLGKREVKTFEIENTSLLPVQWRLDKVADLPEEFLVTPVEGLLPARESATIRIELTATEAKNLAGTMVLKVQDEKGVMPVVQEVPIPLAGEAYDITTDIKYPTEEYQGLDFGTVRVCDTAMQTITVTNQGKYDIGFNMNFKNSGPLKELLTVDPVEGTIPAGKAQEIKVHFNQEQHLNHEVHLTDNAQMSLHIIEPLNNNTETTIPMPVSVHAVLSKYSITPARGLIFGPNVYNSESQPRTINVRNEGDFPFHMMLFKLGDEVPEKPAEDAKGGKEKAAAPTLTLGQFVFEPASCVIQPGQTQPVKVVFNAQKRAQYTETVGIHITERDENDSPQGIPYEVAGESCIPGINAEDVGAIFEEHRVMPKIDPFHPVPGTYAVHEKVFDFGSVIATLGEGDATETRASFKISNPVKVPCSVNFKLTPRQQAEDKSGGVPPPFPMQIEPAKINIPPHEYRYVTVKFAPSAIRQYSADFLAEVENGSGNAKTSTLAFEVRGEGVLPHLSLVQPSERDSAGRPVLKFPRILRGKSSGLPIVVRNDGSIPTTARLDCPPHMAFRMEGGGGLFTLNPGEQRNFQMRFDPPDAGDFSHEVGLDVKHNPFEQLKLMASGVCFVEDVVFTALPEDLSDELHFPDGPMGVEQEVLFNLKNLTDQSTILYHFTNLPAGVQIVPAAGILRPGAMKSVQATLLSAEKLSLKGHEVLVKLEQVTFEGEPFDWELSPADLEASRQSTPPPQEEKGKKGKGKKDAAPPVPDLAIPEAIKVAEGTAKTMPLYVHAVVDSPSFRADDTPIDFKPTMMFQTRSYSFPLANTSGASMEYSFRVEMPSGDVDTTGPFKVYPERGSIAAGEETIITVRFSPKEVENLERSLICTIPHLPEDVEPLVRKMTGAVLRPWCHFELPESDYLSAGRRNPEMPDAEGKLGPLDKSTRVLEMESLGLKVRNTKRFYVLNPTSVTYEFMWEQVGISSSSDGPFVCQTRRGVVTGGKRYEMVFSYVPDSNQLEESHWVFKIPQQGIHVPFLLVGHVKEPQVMMDLSAVNFGMVQVGGKVRETVHMVNEEAIPFEFSFDKASFEATAARLAMTGQRPTCTFEPLSGSVAPNSRLPITVQFEPTKEGMHNYNVVCNVRRKPTRLTLNVKGEGYELQDSLSLDAADGRSLPLTEQGDNHVEFGEVIINERAVKQLSLINSGTVAYDFLFSAGENGNVAVTPLTGRVGPGDKVLLDLTYSPKRPETLSDYLVTCQIVNGRKYRMRLNAVGHKPKLDLSFYSHNFGPQFIVEQGVRPAKAVLRATNNDSKEISFDCLYENTPHLQVDCPPTVLAPGQSQDIQVTFSPQEERAYSELVPIELNGLTSVSVSFTGSGCPMRLSLADKSHSVNLGSAKVGQQVTRVVRLKNSTPVPVDLDLSLAAEVLEKLSVDISPRGKTVIRGRETLELSLMFRPQARKKPFQANVEAVASGRRMTLFQLLGACLGIEVKLASESAPFGAVVTGSMVTKRIQLENTGDVGTKFTWDTAALGKHFRISPATGFIAAGEDVKLDVTFEPKETHADIRVERVRCILDGCDDQFLTLTGACVAQEAQPDKVSFQAPVRETQEKTITVKNPSATDWVLRPVIHNEAWSGAEFLTVPAGKSANFTIKYQPMRMTTAPELHVGSAFFPLPNGSGLLYTLSGTADAPKSSGKVEVKVPAKVQHQEVVKVTNWDKQNQRFAVSVTLDNKPKACLADAPEYIDVPGLTARDLRINLLNPLEGNLAGQIKCTNVSTGEYMFYDLAFQTTAPQSQGKVVLECPVRQKATAGVKISNPLDDPVTLDVKCSNPLVEVPAKLEVPANGSATLAASFRPLVEEETSCTIDLSNADLGKFVYDVDVRGLPTGPEKSLEFSVPLGTQETRKLSVRHFLTSACDYAVSFAKEGKAGFSCPAPVKAPATPAGESEGVELSFEVMFEPKAIGENFRDTLILKNDKGGKYECPLVARCIPPKPRGPIDVKGAGGTVPFRNVFDRDVEFSLVVEDNPSFVVKDKEVIKAKTTANISVQYKPVEGASAMGTLKVMCAETTSPWCFYLRAEQ